MKILSDSPRHPAIPSFGSSLRSRSLSYEFEICAESSRDRIDDSLSPRIASRCSGYVTDNRCMYAEKLQFCSPHHLVARHADDDDDDDDDMQWANTKEPLEAVIQRSGYADGKGFFGEQLESYSPHQVEARQPHKNIADDEDIQLPNQSYGHGDGKGFCAGKIASGKETKIRVPPKPASYPISIVMQQHAGPIKPNSGPFSGPLNAVAKPNCAKPSRATSIIPMNLLRKKMLGFSVCEPMSPKVTCLGRVKMTEISGRDLHMMTDDRLSSAVTPKGRCFDTKNQLCGRKGKGRKKKKVAEKVRCVSRRRRFAMKEAADSKSVSFLETVQTRREKAASLASSLSDWLEDVRRLEKGDTHYVPSVPPRNSLLLMRGGRRLIVSPGDEASIHDDCAQECVDVVSSTTKRRKSSPPHLSLLDLIDMEEGIRNEDFASSEEEHIMTTQDLPAIAQSSSLLENCATVKENEMMNDEGLLLPPPPQRAILLWQRRSVAELRAIEVGQCTKEKIRQQRKNT